MAENPEDDLESPDLFRLPPTQPPEVHPKERAEVTRMISEGRSRSALKLCKDIHQRRQSPESEALLVDAYYARILSLMEQKQESNARAILRMVCERYRSASSRLADCAALLGTSSGDFDSLLAPLNDPSLPPARQAAITERIRRTAVDLDKLAACTALPPDHPLRVAAGALWAAFGAVTSGPVSEDAVALLEVSRQSPLAPWKMLIRAIAAYYRGEDGMCEKYLAAVDPDSAPSMLVPALHVLIRKKRNLRPRALGLVRRLGGDTEGLKHAFQLLDNAFNHGKKAQILAEIGKAVGFCRQTELALLERLMQHISIRAMARGLKPGPVAAAMNGNSRKDAWFWRLLARSNEEDKRGPYAIPVACSAWEEFRKHAIREGWIPAHGPEVAAVYLHIAELWERIPPELRENTQSDFFPFFQRNIDYYDRQPPEIQALRPDPDKPDLYYLFPQKALQRACEADPCSENFQRWLRGGTELGRAYADQVAENWADVLPSDIPPLLHLMESAEKRNALTKAFKYMERAERIDGLNPEVRRARLRLLVSMAIRHLKSKKLHLAEGDLLQVEGLPQAQQGDRPAFVAALRWAFAELGGRGKDVADARAAVARQLDSDIAAHLVLHAVAGACGFGLRESLPALKKLAVAAPAGRACALGDDMGLPLEPPNAVWYRVEEEICDKNFRAPAPSLVALGEAAIRQETGKLAYAIAGAGLSQGPECQGRLLFLRARGMPPWEPQRRAECEAAAAELARRQRDTELLNRIGQWRDEESEFFDAPTDAAATTLSTERIRRIVQRESERGYPPEPEEYFEGGESFDPLPFGNPRSVPRELADMLEQFGPETVAQALAEIMGNVIPGGRKKSRKRRVEITDDDVPF